MQTQIVRQKEFDWVYYCRKDVIKLCRKCKICAVKTDVQTRDEIAVYSNFKKSVKNYVYITLQFRQKIDEGL